MQDSTSREKILKKIRQTLIPKSPKQPLNVEWDKDIYSYSAEAPEVAFAEAFSKAGGQFIYCNNEVDFLEKLLVLSEEKNWKNFYCWENTIKNFLDKIEFPYTTEESKFQEE